MKAIKIQARTFKVRPFRPAFVMALILAIIALSHVFSVGLATPIRIKLIEVIADALSR